MSNTVGTGLCPLLSLPSELIFHVLSFLNVSEIVTLAGTCRHLRAHANDEFIWERLVHDVLPNAPEKSLIRTSWRSLYLSQHPYWFLPKQKIWFSDHAYTGSVLLARYDLRTGAIEGYRLLCHKEELPDQYWADDPTVLIRTFRPELKLHHDHPVLKFKHPGHDGIGRGTRWSGRETITRTGYNPRDCVYTGFSLCSALPPGLEVPFSEVWPPRGIEASERVLKPSDSYCFQTHNHEPTSFDQISQNLFRLRTWMQFSVGGQAFGVRMGEEISTWSTLDPRIYTPTKDKPYQGIYVGDYGPHGCELMLVTQGKSHDYSYWVGSQLVRPMGSTVSPEVQAGLENQPDQDFHGRIQAVKLTGDHNVPRGEITWIANEIGPGGLIRIAQEVPFKGARIVRSHCLLATANFQHHQCVNSQLILVSHSKLAHYWQELNFISEYHRVDIDTVLGLTPKTAN